MHRAATTLAALAAAALACGCGAAASDPGTVTPSPTASAAPSPTPSGTPTGATTSTAAPAPSSRQVTEADDRGTVTLRTGGTLTVVLHSTYWQYDPPSDPSVLRSAGDPTYAPDPPGRCVPGGGCGTATATFHALRPGRAVVTAHRTSCGEALRCVGDAGRFSVTVEVSG